MWRAEIKPGRETMFNKFTLSAVVASILVTAGSTAIAAPKHAVRHQPTIQQQIPANTYLSFGAVRSTGSANLPSNMKIQDIGLNESLGD
jgi:hypothetical protein